MADWRTDLAQIVDRMPVTCCVVTASDAGVDAGCLVGSVMTIGVADRLFAVALAVDSTTGRTVSASGLMGIHLLGEDAVDTARRFSAPHRTGSSKFDGLARRRGPAGVPVLDRCIGVIEARVVQEIRVVGYRMFIARPIGARLVDATAAPFTLLTAQRAGLEPPLRDLPRC